MNQFRDLRCDLNEGLSIHLVNSLINGEEECPGIWCHTHGSVLGEAFRLTRKLSLEAPGVEGQFFPLSPRRFVSPAPSPLPSFSMTGICFFSDANHLNLAEEPRDAMYDGKVEMP